MPTKIDRPTCLECGKPLRTYRRLKEEDSGKCFGDYGDNFFCGLNCGYRWAVMKARFEEKARPGWLKIYRGELQKELERRGQKS